MSGTARSTGDGSGSHHTARAGALLIFALAGAPIGWFLQLSYLFFSTSYACVGSGVTTVSNGMHLLLIGSNCGGLLIAAAALASSLFLVRRVAQEHQQAEGIIPCGDERRTRFFVVLGFWTSVIFLIATLANSTSLFLVSLCN